MKRDQKPDVMDRLRIPMAAALIAADLAGDCKNKEATSLETIAVDGTNSISTKQKAIQYRIYLDMYESSPREEVIDNVLGLIVGTEFVKFCEELDKAEVPAEKNPINSKIFSLLSKSNPTSSALIECLDKLKDTKISNKEFYEELGSLLKQRSYNL